MIQSMTGYGFGEYSDDRYNISAEIKGYNNRYLDIQLTMPSTLGAMENELRTLIKEQFTRGRVEVYIRVQSSESQAEARVDLSQGREIADALHTLKAAAGAKGPVTLDHLLHFEGLIRLEKNRDPEAIRPMITDCIKKAVDDFRQSRMREGETTVADINAQLERFEHGFGGISRREKDIENHINSQLRSRFAEVLGDQVEEQRVLTELAALVVKHSINEELSRLGAHISQFRSEIEAGGALGKRLDFLCQEMNRETNTIGSKNLLTEISSFVIEMKDALENIREQLRNIE